ncbi:MAG TPA: sulfatase-like hydrolase/transferase, partial [Pirellulales bacterium]|nr:sulfatase-like hydrolase/transferase [Pirellulales bacterium]
MGCTGNRDAQTPNIDRLAREGMVFNNFFVTTPLCSPSRASFLTGLYPHAHRIINNDKIGLDVISHTLVTFPRMLREAGYETAFIGKWHMGLDDSRRPGFDHWISFKGQGLYIDPVVNDNGLERQLDGNMTDHLNRWAVQFIERPHSRPFVLYLSHKAVHAPFLPPERFDEKFASYRFSPPASANDDWSGKPALRRKVSPIDVLRLEGAVPEPGEPRRGRGNTSEDVVRDQMRCLAAVDEGVGQIYAALEKRGLLDDTVFIYTADNGYMQGEHRMSNEKRFAYEESIRLPLVVRYPAKIRAGTTCDAMLLNVDIAPTLMELGGGEPLQPMHGRSFVPLLANPRSPWRDAVLLEYFLEKVAGKCPDWQAVRTARWKFIHYPTLEGPTPEGMDELYDLQSDPHEITNRI